MKVVGTLLRSSDSFDAFAVPHGISVWCSGTIGASEVFDGGIAPYAFTLSSANSKAIAATAAAASTTITITRNRAGTITQIGTIVFAAAGTVGTITFTATDILLNDFITFTGPSTADTGLANIAILLKD